MSHKNSIWNCKNIQTKLDRARILNNKLKKALVSVDTLHWTEPWHGFKYYKRDLENISLFSPRVNPKKRKQSNLIPPKNPFSSMSSHTSKHPVWDLHGIKKTLS